jgi:dynein heavy chain
VILDRRKYGHIGWSTPYDFSIQVSLHISNTVEDFQASIESMKYDSSFKTMRFMCTEIHYGGRVVEQNDKILLDSMFFHFLGDLRDGYKFSDSGIYRSVESGGYYDYLRYVQSLPHNSGPEAYGLHPN